MPRKAIRVVLLSLVLLLAVAGLFAFLLNNETFVRQQLSHQLFKATGWQLEIQGEFVLAWGRQTRIQASQVRLLNPQWPDQPLMFSSEELSVLWQPLRLWDKELIIDDLQLVHCNANYLEADERSNWLPVSDSGPEKAPDPAGTESSEEFSWQLQNLGLSECQIAIRRERHEQTLDIVLQQARLQTTPDQVLTASMDGNLEDQRLSLQGNISPMTALWQGGTMRHEITLLIGKTQLQSRGSIADFRFGDGAELQMHFSGPEFSNVTEWLAWPDLGSGPFDARLNLNEQGTGLTGFELDGNFGSLQLKGSGELDRLVEPKNGSVDLQIKGPDLAAIGELLDQHWLIRHEFDLSVQADLQQGRTELHKLLFRAGENRISAQGVLGPWPGMEGSDLKSELHSPDLAQWQPDSLQAIQLFGPLQATIGMKVNPQAELELDVKGSLSDNRFAVQGNLGQGSLGLRPAGSNPSASVVLESASLQRFALLFKQENWPNQPFSLTGKLLHSDDGVQLNHIQLKMADDTLDLNGKVVLGEELRGSEFKAALKLPDLSATGRRFDLADLPAQPLSLSATLRRQGKGLKFDVGDGALAGIRIRMRGDMPDMKNPLVVNSTLDLDLPSARMAEFLIPGRQLPDLPLTAKGALVNSGSATRLQGFAIQLGQNQASLDGEWQTKGNHAGSKASLRIKGRDIRELWPKAPERLQLGIYHLSVDWLRKADGDYLEALQADLGLLKLTADGRITDASHATALDLRLDLSGTDASRFNEFTGQPFVAEPFALKLGLKGNPKLLEFQGIDLRWGKSDVSGQLQLDLNSASRPALRGELSSTTLDATPWQQEFANKAAAESQQSSKQTAKKPARKEKQKLLSDQSFNLVQESPLDLDLDIHVAELLLKGTGYRQINLGLQVDADSLQLQPFEFHGINGGSYRGNVSSQRRGGTSSLDLLVQAEDLKLGFAGLSGLDPAKMPPSDVFLKLDGQGNTWHELGQSLNGKLRWYQGSGTVSKNAMSFIFSDFLTEVLNTLNPLSKKSDLTQLNCAVFAADAVKGKVAVAPIVYQTDQITAFSEGSIDLATEVIDLSFRTVARKGLGLSAGTVVNPFFKIGGTLVKPALHLDVTKGAISGGVMVATAGLSVLFKSVSDRLLSSKDPCGEARKALEQRDAG